MGPSECRDNTMSSIQLSSTASTYIIITVLISLWRLYRYLILLTVTTKNLLLGKKRKKNPKAFTYGIRWPLHNREILFEQSEKKNVIKKYGIKINDENVVSRMKTVRRWWVLSTYHLPPYRLCPYNNITMIFIFIVPGTLRSDF